MSYKGFTITENYEGVSFYMNFSPEVRYYASSIIEAKELIDEMCAAWEYLLKSDLALYELERKG